MRGAPSHYGVFGLNVCPIFHTVFLSRMCTTTPYLSSVKACTITMGSDTSPHVLIFTGFDHTRERRRLEYVFLTRRCGDGDSEVSGSGVSRVRA